MPWFAWRPVKLTKTNRDEARTPDPDYWELRDIQIAWMCWVKRYDSGDFLYYTNDEMEVPNE